MAIPLSHMVQVHHFVTTTEVDAHGNVAGRYVPPLDRPGLTVKVYGWAMRQSSDVDIDDHAQRIDTWVDLFAPAGTGIGNRDVVDLDPAAPTRLRYVVDGDPRDYDTGPWSFKFKPGVVIALRKVDG